MPKCSKCASEIEAGAVSNAQRMITFTIPEDMASVLSRVMVSTINREGMHGNYHTARLMKVFFDQIDRSALAPRGLGAESIAQVMAAQDEGWELSYRLDKRRIGSGLEVRIDGRGPDGREIVLGTAGVPLNEDPEQTMAAVKDFFDRRPLPQREAEDAPQHT